MVLTYYFLTKLENFQRTTGRVTFRSTTKLTFFILNLQGVPKKIGLLSSVEFLGWGGVLLGVKNYSKNSGTKKNIGSYSKILSKWAFFIRKM